MELGWRYMDCQCFTDRPVYPGFFRSQFTRMGASTMGRLDCLGDFRHLRNSADFYLTPERWRGYLNQQYNSAPCFACGVKNPSGLRLRFYDNGQDQVFTHFTIDQQHAGYPGMAHGGIVAAILDEVGGRTVMINKPHCFFVTARMDVRFRQPVPIGMPLDATGWLLKRSASRTRAHAEIFTDGQGTLAEANMLFTDLPPRLFDPYEAESRFGWRLYD